MERSDSWMYWLLYYSLSAKYEHMHNRSNLFELRFLTHFNWCGTVAKYFWLFHKSEQVQYNVCIDILYHIAGCHWVMNSKPNSRISFNKQNWEINYLTSLVTRLSGKLGGAWERGNNLTMLWEVMQVHHTFGNHKVINYTRIMHVHPALCHCL